MSSPMNLDINSMIFAWCIVAVVVMVLLGLGMMALAKWVRKQSR